MFIYSMTTIPYLSPRKPSEESPDLLQWMHGPYLRMSWSKQSIIQQFIYVILFLAQTGQYTLGHLQYAIFSRSTILFRPGSWNGSGKLCLSRNLMYHSSLLLSEYLLLSSPTSLLFLVVVVGVVVKSDSSEQYSGSVVLPYVPFPLAMLFVEFPLSSLVFVEFPFSLLLFIAFPFSLLLFCAFPISLSSFAQNLTNRRRRKGRPVRETNLLSKS